MRESDACGRRACANAGGVSALRTDVGTLAGVSAGVHTWEFAASHAGGRWSSPYGSGGRFAPKQGRGGSAWNPVGVVGRASVLPGVRGDRRVADHRVGGDVRDRRDLGIR